MPKTVDTNRIHHAALQVFVERGYEAATTKDIAERAGVNEATLYRRYNTKAELVRTALADQLGQSPFGHLSGSDDARADIALIVKAYIETFETFGAVVMALMNDAKQSAELQSATSALLPNLQNAAGIIARHQVAGRISPGNPMAKLLTLIAPVAMVGLAPPPMRRLIGEIHDLDPVQIAADFLDGHSP
jgi:AcrR family transcriptional regulator